MEENLEYDEQEDEFDVVPAEEMSKRKQDDEDILVDVTTCDLQFKRFWIRMMMWRWMGSAQALERRLKRASRKCFIYRCFRTNSNHIAMRVGNDSHGPKIKKKSPQKEGETIVGKLPTLSYAKTRVMVSGGQSSITGDVAYESDKRRKNK